MHSWTCSISRCIQYDIQEVIRLKKCSTGSNFSRKSLAKFNKAKQTIRLLALEAAAEKKENYSICEMREIWKTQIDRDGINKEFICKCIFSLST